MTRSPLKRLVGGFGLLAMVPIGVLLIQGRLTVAEAGIRAGALLVAVAVVLRVSRFAVEATAVAMERRGSGDPRLRPSPEE